MWCKWFESLGFHCRCIEVISENLIYKRKPIWEDWFLCGISLNDLSVCRCQSKHFVILQKGIIDFWKQMYRARKESHNSFWLLFDYIFQHMRQHLMEQVLRYHCHIHLLQWICNQIVLEEGFHLLEAFLCIFSGRKSWEVPVVNLSKNHARCLH